MAAYSHDLNRPENLPEKQEYSSFLTYWRLEVDVGSGVKAQPI